MVIKSVKKTVVVRRNVGEINALFTYFLEFRLSLFYSNFQLKKLTLRKSRFRKCFIIHLIWLYQVKIIIELNYIEKKKLNGCSGLEYDGHVHCTINYEKSVNLHKTILRSVSVRQLDDYKVKFWLFSHFLFENTVFSAIIVFFLKVALFIILQFL